MTIYHGYYKNHLSRGARRASLPPVPHRHWRFPNEKPIAQISQIQSPHETESKTQAPDPAACFGFTHVPHRPSQNRPTQAPVPLQQRRKTAQGCGRAIATLPRPLRSIRCFRCSQDRSAPLTDQAGPAD